MLLTQALRLGVEAGATGRPWVPLILNQLAQFLSFRSHRFRFPLEPDKVNRSVLFQNGQSLRVFVHSKQYLPNVLLQCRVQIPAGQNHGITGHTLRLVQNS